MGEMKSARTGGTGGGKKNINLHHPMTNQFLYENGTQAADRNRENSARVVLYTRGGFHLFIPVCF